jgi:hypothetical protein
MIGIIGYGVIGKTTHQALFPFENIKFMTLQCKLRSQIFLVVK